MSAVTATRRPAAMRIVSETALLTGRSLRAIPRVPERLLDVTIQPVIFILLFLYVFGSAIHVAGISYKDYLFPGILGQSLAFGVITIGILFALGWSPDLSLLHGLELAGLLLLAMFAFTWVGLLLGLLIRSPDAVQGAAFIVVLPLTFMAGTFVTIQHMQLIPRVIGEWDPISPIVASARNLTTHIQSHGSLPLDHPELATIAYCLILLAVCVPLALRRFNRVTAA